MHLESDFLDHLYDCGLSFKCFQWGTAPRPPDADDG